MYQTDVIVEKMFRVYNIMQENGKQPRDFGIGHLLFQAELHTLSAICKHELVNASELAQIMGITKGAITQVVNKLIQKGLVEKFNMPGNKKEVYFRLTENGTKVNDDHCEHDKEILQPVNNYLCQLDENKLAAIGQYFDILLTSLKK